MIVEGKPLAVSPKVAFDSFLSRVEDYWLQLLIETFKRYLKVLKFQFALLKAQYEASNVDEAKSFFLESPLPKGSTAKKWILDQPGRYS